MRGKGKSPQQTSFFRGTGNLLYAISDGGESLVAGEDGVTVQEVVGIARVENIFVQAGHVVECDIEGGGGSGGGRGSGGGGGRGRIGRGSDSKGGGNCKLSGAC